MQLEGNLSKRVSGTIELFTSGAFCDKLTEYSLVLVGARYTPAV